jgi:alkyl hydroperoxide reductase subunit AhpC
MNLSSNASAGPIRLDQAKDQMFFLDNNPVNRFIGVAPLSLGNRTTYSLNWVRAMKFRDLSFEYTPADRAAVEDANMFDSQLIIFVLIRFGFM